MKASLNIQTLRMDDPRHAVLHRSTMLKTTLLVAGLAAASLASAQDQVVRIGTIAPISGPQAHYGKDTQNGVRLAIDDLNAKGVTINGKKIKFELAAEDDAADPKQGTAAAQKLCDAKVAGAVAFVNSGVAIPASKIFHDCRIPMITGAATNPDLTKQGWDTTYRVIANDNALGAALAHYAAKTLNLKTVAVIDDRTAYGQGLANVFKRDAAKDGMQIVTSEFTTDKATDFMAILTNVKAKKPQAVFYGGMDAQAGPMLRQLGQLGLNDVKYFGGDGLCTPQLSKLSAGAKPLENVICADGGSSLAKMPGGAEWKKRYDAKFPGEFQIYSPYFYDATMLLADAMVRAKSWDPKVYIPFLQKTDYSGVTAKISFEKNGEMKNPAYTLSVYKNGEKTALEP